MPVARALLLKDGGTLGVKKKRKKGKNDKKDKPIEGEDEREGDGKGPLDRTEADDAAPKVRQYEEEFKLEMSKVDQGKARSNAWGVTHRAPPKVLHGYDREVQGDTFQERLDIRCAKKSDRMCK